MILLLEIIFWISGISVFYAYFGYPLVLSFLGKKEQEISVDNFETKTFSIVVTARNELAGIEEKILNSLELIDAYKKQSSGKAELIVASDCSDDGTDEIVESYADRGVKLFRSEERKGKEFAQKNSLTLATGEIIFFTDVRARLESDALILANQYFQDASVGAISTNDIVEVQGQSSGEGFYVKYEMLLRKLESRFCSLIGLSGSGFAVRKSICSEMSTDVPSDFSLILAARANGLKGVQADDITCTYKAAKTEEQEFNRKTRTVLRGITTFFKAYDFKSISKDMVFAWQMLSHKLCRWLVPWQLILIAISLLCLMFQSGIYLFFSLVMFVFIGLALVGYFVKSTREITFVKVPLFFLVTNSAIFIAWLRYLSGDRSVSWTPTKRD